MPHCPSSPSKTEKKSPPRPFSPHHTHLFISFPQWNKSFSYFSHGISPHSGPPFPSFPFILLSFHKCILEFVSFEAPLPEKHKWNMTVKGLTEKKKKSDLMRSKQDFEALFDSFGLSLLLFPSVTLPLSSVSNKVQINS